MKNIQIKTLEELAQHKTNQQAIIKAEERINTNTKTADSSYDEGIFKVYLLDNSGYNVLRNNGEYSAIRNLKITPEESKEVFDLIFSKFKEIANKRVQEGNKKLANEALGDY